ncbi:iron-containing alcohol dehydrogenase [bacterium]|nr:iron-containing alcohol dehydrogenase [bacterium]
MDNYFRVKSSIHDYDVIFSESFCENLKKDIEKPCAVIIDKNVFDIYGKALESVVEDLPVYCLEVNENNKSLKTIEEIVIFLIENGFKKTHHLIAIGGGITQDITCFIAMTLFRGVKWFFYPTTLLSQCDSCIGSKSSINVLPFKNQLGSFYPPSKIVIDVSFTESLDKKEILSGLGEAIKVHYLDEEFRFEKIFKNYSLALTDRNKLEEVVYDSLIIKKKVIEIDEYDRDYRNIMNYGHTFGHALESVTRYQLPHGMAVAFGMGIVNYLSRELGFLESADFEKMELLVKENTKGIEFRIEDLDELWEALKKDKKNVDEDVVFILTRGFGKMFKHKLPLDESLKKKITLYLEEIKLIAE